MAMLTSVKEKAKTLLLRIQQVTRTDMLYAAKGGFWLSFGSGASTLVSLAVAVAFANLAPKETYGSYKYLMSIAGTLAAFALTGLAEPIVRAVARGYEGTLRALFRKALTWNSLVSLAALAGAAWYLFQGNRTLAAALVAIALFQPIAQSAGLYAAHLRGLKDFRTSTAYGLMRSLLPSALIIIGLLLTDDPAVFVWLYLGGGAAAAMTAYVWTNRRKRKNDAVDPEALTYGAHLSFINVLGGVVASADKILIFQVLGAVPTAVYALAQALPEQIDAQLWNIRSLALPKFAAQEIRGAWKPLVRKSLLIAAAAAFLMGAYALAAPTLFSIVFPSYAEAAPYSALLGAVLIVTGPSQLLFAFLTAHRDMAARYAVGLVPSVVWIILLVALVKPYGLYGVIAAKLAAKTTGAALCVWFSYRLTRKAEAAPASPSA